MDRLLKITGTGMLYLAASLFLAQVILLSYLAYAWQINKNKLNQMIAIAQGFDLFQSEEILRRQVEAKVQQMSYDEVLRMRAERGLREDYDKSKVGQAENILLAEVRQQEDRKKQFDEVVLNFEKRIADLEEQAKSRGFTELVAMFEALDPELARKHVLIMIKDKQVERVVLLLRAMDETRRKKLLNVLREDEDIEEIADIFRRVGDGEPESLITDEAKQQLN